MKRKIFIIGKLVEILLILFLPIYVLYYAYHYFSMEKLIYLFLVACYIFSLIKENEQKWALFRHYEKYKDIIKDKDWYEKNNINPYKNLCDNLFDEDIFKK